MPRDDGAAWVDSALMTDRLVRPDDDLPGDDPAARDAGPIAGPDAGVGAWADPFEVTLDLAIERLPPELAGPLESVAIVVEDEATPAQLAEVHAPGLYGLYQGVPRTAYGADRAVMPSKITLFRGPLMRANRTPTSLVSAVEATLRHEIGHHLGLSDERISELEAAARRSRP
jgi:predicted Zn-dependent protease with MMP-like domain